MELDRGQVEGGYAAALARESTVFCLQDSASSRSIEFRILRRRNSRLRGLDGPHGGSEAPASRSVGAPVPFVQGGEVREAEGGFEGLTGPGGGTIVPIYGVKGVARTGISNTCRPSLWRW